MEIEAWFESMPSEVVNDIAREKRYIMFAIHDKKALVYKNQDNIIKDINTMSRKVKNAITEKPVVTRDAGKSQEKSGTGQRKTRWASADIRTREHKDAVRELASNANFVLDTIVELVDDGYDLNIKRTDKGATIRAMLFCNVPGNANDNGGLSAEAPDAWLALSALVYKHINLLDGNWFNEADESQEDDNWR